MARATPPPTLAPRCSHCSPWGHAQPAEPPQSVGFPTHIATATSHFVLAVMSGVGALTHVATGSFAHGHGIRRAAALSIGVVAGAQAGAHLSLRLRGRVIELLLAVALLALAARLLAAA